MSEKEIRALSDETLIEKLDSLAPTIKQRTPEGGVTPEAGQALRESIPYHTEIERRKTLALSAKLRKTLADLDAEARAERERTEAAFRLYGNPLND